MTLIVEVFGDSNCWTKMAFPGVKYYFKRREQYRHLKHFQVGEGGVSSKNICFMVGPIKCENLGPLKRAENSVSGPKNLYWTHKKVIKKRP